MTSHTAFPVADRVPPVRLPPGGPEDVTTPGTGGEVRPVTAGAVR